MAKPNQIYQPLSRNPWLHVGSVRPWRSSDHLLLVENRFFTEHYTRLFWADIQIILLYRLHRSSSVLLVLEAVCLLAGLLPLLFRNMGWSSLAGLAFLLFYAAWRLARPSWACEVATGINLKQFALPGTLASCRRVLEEMKNSVTLAQGTLPDPSTAAAPVSVASRITSPPKQPVLIVHVITFVLGLLSPFSIFFFVVYCGMLIAAWFLQQDFRFPFAVRSAAVMSQIFTPLHILFWALAKTQLPHMRPFPFNFWQFGIPQVLFSLYGIAAIYARSIEFAKPQQKSSTVLGLG